MKLNQSAGLKIVCSASVHKDSTPLSYYWVSVCSLYCNPLWGVDEYIEIQLVIGRTEFKYFIDHSN